MDLWGFRRMVRSSVFFCFFFFVFFWGGGGGGWGVVVQTFQEYFTYFEPIVHQRWVKMGEPGEKPSHHL